MRVHPAVHPFIRHSWRLAIALATLQWLLAPLLVLAFFGLPFHPAWLASLAMLDSPRRPCLVLVPDATGSQSVGVYFFDEPLACTRLAWPAVPWIVFAFARGANQIAGILLALVPRPP